ncbi:hypothetical protein F5Y11DRAFT_152436 [Daldinia sp. FL1419]|nr:hypothetical protein F5Y11DRAFT_152436 [Daldinia sp. FL1419]
MIGSGKKLVKWVNTEPVVGSSSKRQAVVVGGIKRKVPKGRKSTLHKFKKLQGCIQSLVYAGVCWCMLVYVLTSNWVAWSFSDGERPDSDRGGSKWSRSDAGNTGDAGDTGKDGTPPQLPKFDLTPNLSKKDPIFLKAYCCCGCPFSFFLALTIVNVGEREKKRPLT